MTACWRVALLLLLVCGCAGCAHPVARPATPAAPAIDARAVAAAVVLCTTTEAELRRRFGEPTRDGIHFDAVIAFRPLPGVTWRAPGAAGVGRQL